MLPYVAALLGIERLPSAAGAAYTPRAYIANMLEYRSGKGTPATLERVAADATGFHARVVEYFRHLVQTQHVNRFRPSDWLAPDLRDLDALERLTGSLTSTDRLPEVRDIDSPYAGRFNIPSLGVHVWPLSVLSPPDATGELTVPIARFAIEARPEPNANDPAGRFARFFLDPLGTPMPLFNRPVGASSPLARTERGLPVRLRRLPLHRELEALRQAMADGAPLPELRYFGGDQPVVQLFVDDELEAVPPAQIRIVDFSRGFPLPAPVQSYAPVSGDVPVELAIRVALDPARGQLAFAPGREPQRLRAVFGYGATARMFGGPYSRTGIERTPNTWQLGVSRLLAPVANEVVATLEEAIAAWNAQPPGTRGVICVMDSMRYAEDLTGPRRILCPAGSHLTLLAADWPAIEIEPGILERQVGSFAPDRLRPSLRGGLEITGTAPAESSDPGAVRVEGLFIEGHIEVTPGHLGRFELTHATLASTGILRVRADDAGRNAELFVAAESSSFVQLDCGAMIESAALTDCIVGDPTIAGHVALALPGVHLELERSTLFGSSHCREVNASECIFMDVLVAERTQAGCVRYCYLPTGSSAPHPFRCQPALARAAAATPALADAAELRVVPLFVSLDRAHPAFARLAHTGPDEIRRGGPEQSELGVFASVQEPLREDFLRATFDDFVRAGLRAGVLYELAPPAIRYG
jgi:hypothetical protein